VGKKKSKKKYKKREKHPPDNCGNDLTRELSAGLQHHQAGRLSEAETLYRHVLETEHENAEALHLLGVLIMQQGDGAQAIRFLTEAVKLKPRAARYHNNLGHALQTVGKYHDALHCFQKAIRIQPSFPEAHYNLGMVLAHLDCFQKAENHYRQALDYNPGYAEVHNNLGSLLNKLGKTDEALRYLKQAITLNPSLHQAHNNLGNILQQLGDQEGAIKHYRQALDLKPDYAKAHSNLGNILQAQGHYEQAESCYIKALSIDPDLAEAINNRGSLLQAQDRYEDAIDHYRRALKINPDYPEAHENLGMALSSLGHIQEAAGHYREALRLKPHAGGVTMKLALLLPPVYASHRDMNAAREQLICNCEKLKHEHLTIHDPIKEAGITNFYCVYHGLNDRQIQEDIAGIYARWYKPPAPALRPVRKSVVPDDRIRIGFVSTYFRGHTIGKLWRGTIANLDRERFHVSVFSIGSFNDEVARFIRQHADHYEALPKILPNIARAIADSCLDVLFFTDIGMEPTTYFLAFSRLAPVQCVTWGHPVTTGVPSMDYFISGEDLETPEGNNHYTEKLVRMRNILYYYRPEVPEPLKGREHFGLPQDSHLYICPQTLFKFHPDFDMALGEILRRDSQGKVILIEGNVQRWNDLLKKRWQTTLPDVADRIRFVPRQTKTGFLNLIAVSDVMLDTFHFGGGNTTYEGLATGTPVVTLPSRFLRGRITNAIYRKMNFTDCIASSPEEYINLAVKIATDREYQIHLRETILKNNYLLYENMGAVRELEEFFIKTAIK